MSELNARQTRFIQEYLVDMNGSAAVIRAGYSSTGAHVTANRLLRNPTISAAIDAGKAQVSSLAEMSREQALLRLKHWAETNDGNLSIRAIAQLSKMRGWEAPTRIEVRHLTPQELKVRMAALLGVVIAHHD